MNGESESEVITKAREVLAKYEEVIKLKPTIGENSATRYIAATQQEISKMHPEELGEAALILAQYAIYLQKEFNTNDGLVKLCDSLIGNIIANDVSNYTGYSYEERKQRAIKGNDAALKLFKARNHFLLVANATQYMPSRVENLSSKYERMAQIKRVK